MNIPFHGEYFYSSESRTNKHPDFGFMEAKPAAAAADKQCLQHPHLISKVNTEKPLQMNKSFKLSDSLSYPISCKRAGETNWRIICLRMLLLLHVTRRRTFSCRNFRPLRVQNKNGVCVLKELKWVVSANMGFQRTFAGSQDNYPVGKWVSRYGLWQREEYLQITYHFIRIWEMSP